MTFTLVVGKCHAHMAALLRSDAHSDRFGIRPGRRSRVSDTLDRPSPSGRLERLGSDALGPSFSYYARHLILRADELALDRLCFLARDGYLLEKVYAVVRGARPGRRPVTSYLHVSRLSTALPSVRSFGLRELRLGFRVPTDRSVASLLRSFQLLDPEMLDRAAHAGVADVTAPVRDPERDPALLRLIGDAGFQAAVASRARAARDLLRRYLGERGFFRGGRMGIVDVGWSGTIQDNLIRAYGDAPDFPDLHGIYLGLFADPSRPADDGAARKEGAIFDSRRDNGFTERAPLHFVEIFEQAARADHGMTLGYADGEAGVQPVLKETGADRDAERIGASAVRALQRGILEFVVARGGGPIERDERDQIKRRLERFIFFPTAEELTAVSELSHSDDWGIASFGRLVSRPAASALLNPRRWLDDFHRAYWKPAYLAQTGGPILCLMYQQYERWKLWRSGLVG